MNEVDIVVTDQDKRLIVSSNNNMESQYISMLDLPKITKSQFLITNS